MSTKKLTDVGFVFFFDWSEALSTLAPEDFKALVLATADYAQGGSAPTSLSPAAQMAFHFISTSIERWHEKSDARAESGRRGGQVKPSEANGSKRKQTEANDEEDKQAEATASYHPHPNPEIDPHADLDPHPLPQPSPACAHEEARGGGGESGGFEKFWEAYPRKLKKSDARLAWAVLAPDDALAERIVNVVRYLERSPDWKRDDGRFIPLPAKFLEERRFDDVGEVPPDPWAALGW